MGTKHYDFNYTFSDTEGITFQEIHYIFNFDYDLAIYYNTLTGSDYIDCRCSRWDVSDYSVVVETWLTPEQANTLRTNTVPGAVSELYEILGRPFYYDKTWQGNNTIRLYPTPSSNFMNNSTLHNMRNDTYIYVKNLSEHPIQGTDWIEVKIEGYISGTQAL